VTLPNQYFFDLYDRSNGCSMNLPNDWKFINAAVPGNAFWLVPPNTELPSWEVTFGMHSANIPPGEECFAVPEGTFLLLTRPGMPDFPLYFEPHPIALHGFTLPTYS
jgi:hypothetical protein